MPTSRPLAPRLTFLLAFLLSACGGGGSDGGTGPNPPPATGGFSITLSPTALSIEQGANGSVTAAITRTGSFTGAVTLLTESVPAGLTPTFTPNVVASGTTSVTLSVAAAATVAPGNYSFVVRAQASGIADQTGTVSLTVTAKPAVAMALSASSASVAQGGSTSFTATVARTNVTAPVTIAITGAPTGVTTSVSSNADVHTLTVNVSPLTAIGIHTLTATASATGVAAVSAAFTLTVTAPPAASIALTAAPTAVSIQAGGAAGSTAIGITRTNFTGTVVVAVQSGLPVGVTATNAPTGPVIGSAVTVTFTATAAAVPGTYNVVLQGAGFQATPGTVTVALTVTPVASASSVTLSAAPAALTIAPGTATTTVLTIARSNFAGTLNLAATGAPSAVTLSLTPTITTGNSASLNVAVGASATPGTYPITVTATGTGLTPATVTIAVTISATTSGGNVAWRFCSLTGFPVWFAYQDGDPTSPWAQVALGAGNSYAFNITTRGAVAYVMQNNPDNYSLHVAYGTRDELGSQGTATCPASGSILKTVTGTVTGFLSATDFATVGLGIAFAQLSPTQAQPNFTIVGVPDGLHDLVATRSTFNATNVANPLRLSKIYLRRGLNPPNLSSVGTVDFNGSDAFDPDSTSVTINGIAGGEQVSTSNTFVTNTQSFGSLGAASLLSGNVLNIFTVPSTKTAAGDVQAIAVNAATISGSLVTQIRSATAVFRDPSNPTVTLGEQVNQPTISTLATAPYARPRAQFTRQADYLDQWSANFSQVGNASPRAVTITMSSAYAGSGSSVDLGLPDFTSVGGWQNSWGPIAGRLVNWNVAMTGWQTPTGGLVDGARYRIGQRQGTFTP